MRYRRIEFAVRARPGRDEWTWTIYPKDARDFSREFTGSREEAICAACQKIDRWLTEHRTQDAKKFKLIGDSLQSRILQERQEFGGFTERWKRRR
jgi:hypothetical protein